MTPGHATYNVYAGYFHWKYMPNFLDLPTIEQLAWESVAAMKNRYFDNRASLPRNDPSKDCGHADVTVKQHSSGYRFNTLTTCDDCGAAATLRWPPGEGEHQYPANSD